MTESILIGLTLVVFLFLFLKDAIPGIIEHNTTTPKPSPDGNAINDRGN